VTLVSILEQPLTGEVLENKRSKKTPTSEPVGAFYTGVVWFVSVVCLRKPFSNSALAKAEPLSSTLFWQRCYNRINLAVTVVTVDAVIIRFGLVAFN
jgi:hypothetical protein